MVSVVRGDMGRWGVKIIEEAHNFSYQIIQRPNDFADSYSKRSKRGVRNTTGFQTYVGRQFLSEQLEKDISLCSWSNFGVEKKIRKRP